MTDTRVIVWRITQTCNMDCLFCSYSNQIDRRRDSANEEQVNRFINSLGEYKKLNNKEILLSWIGGEPFLWEPIIRLSEKLKRDFGIKVSTTTNGLMLDSKEIQDCVLDYYDEIVISLDGFEECNDMARNLNGHFEIVTKNILKLSERKREHGSNLVIKVNTILMRDNIGYFEQFCYMLLDLGVNELTFNQLGGYDRPEFYPNNRLEKQQVEAFYFNFENIKATFLELGLIIHGGENYEKRIKATTEDKKIEISECNPGSWFWFINENGYISPCSYTTYEYMYDLKNIQNINDVEKVEEEFRKERNTKLSKWCSDCHCTQVYNKFI
jgi:MoaA/NifB/PqqE/SkfB family radical SAM enzyme